MTYSIEHLGKYEFIFETVLGYVLVSGDQMGSFEAKKTESKISCLGTFKMTPGYKARYYLFFSGHWPDLPENLSFGVIKRMRLVTL